MGTPDRDERLWVAPSAGGEELGTRDKPFGDIGRALSRARPGQTVVLACGVYEGDRTIQHSGTMESPISIVAEKAGGVVVSGCWFFYDVSDVVVSGLVFRDAPAGAVSLMGACSRNALRDLVFEGCSLRKRPAATLYLGGSGGRCNMIERCVFRHAGPESDDGLAVDRASVAVMVAQGDREGGMANEDLIVRGNTFTNYGFGVMVGTQDDAAGQYGHRLEHNTFEGCRGEAITVKCGDTTVIGNAITGAGRAGVALRAGMSSSVIGNRIRGCGTGIRLCGAAHTVAHNCSADCGEQAVHVSGAAGPGLEAASAVLVERNTVVDCGNPAGGAACGIRTDPGTSCIVRANLFAGPGLPYREPSDARDPSVLPSMFVDNVATQGAFEAAGCRRQDVVFADRSGRDYRNDSGYGAEGWSATAEAPHADAESGEEDYRAAMADGAESASESSAAAEDLVSGGQDADPAGRGLFFAEPQDGEHPADA